MANCKCKDHVNIYQEKHVFNLKRNTLIGQRLIILVSQSKYLYLITGIYRALLD